MKQNIITTLILLFTFASFAQTRYLTIESNHSTIGFWIDIAGGMTKVQGKFTETDLEIDYVENTWAKSKAKFTIQASSINTGIAGRDEHLRSADFFDVENYPEIIFVSKRIRQVSENQFIATGDFSMHGITKELELPFEIKGEDGNTIGIAIETVINRLDFGVGEHFKHSAIPNFLSDKIQIEIYFWTKRDKRKE